MGEILRGLLLNAGKVIGIVLGLVLAFMLLFLGILKTLFVIALVTLGYILGKWYDEGVSISRAIKDLASALRVDKWHI